MASLEIQLKENKIASLTQPPKLFRAAKRPKWWISKGFIDRVSANRVGYTAMVKLYHETFSIVPPRRQYAQDRLPHQPL